MSPYKKAKHRNGQARESHEAVTKDVLARKVSNQLADYSHSGQNHDVDRRVRIEPEQMLKQYRIAADCRIKDSNSRHPLKRKQQHSDRDYGSTQNKDQGSRVYRPQKQRHAEPGHARSPHSVDGNDEIQSRQNR